MTTRKTLTGLVGRQAKRISFLLAWWGLIERNRVANCSHVYIEKASGMHACLLPASLCLPSCILVHAVACIFGHMCMRGCAYVHACVCVVHACVPVCVHELMTVFVLRRLSSHWQQFHLTTKRLWCHYTPEKVEKCFPLTRTTAALKTRSENLQRCVIVNNFVADNACLCACVGR